MSEWGHWSKHPETIPEDAIGFVYKITDKTTNKFYIGCKQLFSKVTKPPLKGMKRKRRSLKESDWKTYCSSSGAIQESIKTNEDGYDFEILSFHDSKSSLKIEEARLIINDIYNPECYNEVVNLRCRVAKTHKNVINNI
jgi:hypothetical protein